MTRQKAVLYLLPNGFYYFQEQLSSVLSVAIPKEVLSDLEVKDVEKFSALLQTFVSSYKLSPSSIAIILSPWMVFEEDIQASPATDASVKKDNFLVTPVVNHTSELQEGVSQDVEHFLSLVPFENVLSRVFPAQKGVKVIAANEDVVRILGETFFQFGSEISSVVPYFAIPGLSFETSGFSIEYASLALSRFESLKQFTLLNQAVAKPKEESASVAEKPISQKKESKRLFVLIGLFVILIGALIVVYFTLGTSQAPSPTPPVSANDSISPQPVEVAVSPVATTAAALSPDVVIGIYSQAGQEQEVVVVKNKLRELGENAIVENIATASPNKTTILFSKNIPLSTREIVVAKLSEIIADFLTQETETEDLVVRIVLSK